MTGRSFGLALLNLFVATSVTSQPLRVPVPEGVYYYQPAASVFGAEALWINPAALARYPASSFQLMFDYENGDIGDSWGYALTGNRYASGWRIVREADGAKYKELLFGAGLGLGNVFDLGGSFRHFTEGAGVYNKRHYWSVGLSSKDGKKVAVGAVWSNLNRGRIGGVRTKIEQRYSLALRPAGPRATLAADMFFSTGNKPSEAEFRYHGEFIPTPGVFLNGFVDSERRWQLGFRVNLTKYFVGAKSSFNRANEELGTNLFVGSTSLRQESIISDPKQRLTASINNLRENPVKPILGRKPLAFTQILTCLYRAGDDPYISEVLVEVGGGFGFAQAEEVRDAMAYCRARGKRVTAFLTTPGNLSYFIGVAADSIVIPPVSQLNLTGLRAELTFYAGTLEKLGVKIELLRIGKYKTAAEAWTREEGSAENREQINRLLDRLFDLQVEAIASGRNLGTDSVRKIIDSGPFTSADALKFGLVDGLSYRDKISGTFLPRMPELTLKEYLSDTLANDSWQTRPRIGVIVADGEIGGEQYPELPFSDGAGVTPNSIRRAFEQAKRDFHVRGLVFRINSPGGDALASDLIHHYALERAKVSKQPLTVSMANTAASGGFYVATASEKIFALPSTITGSIGIFGGKADLSGLHEKIDLGKELFTRGKFSGMLTTIRPFTDEEREKYFSQLQALYKHFISLVGEDRNLSIDSVDALGQGKVWTGGEALLNGLIDSNGGLKQALDYTARQSGISSYDVVVYPENRPLFILPKFPLFETVGKLFSKKVQGDKTLESLTEDHQMLMRLPYDLVIE